MIFHGGNSTTPFHLRDFLGLREHYLIYTADIIGHPGKRAQTVLSAKNLEYGQWAADLIDELPYNQMICLGSSFGGEVIAKLIYVAPEKIKKAVLIVPAGICNVSTLNIIFKLGIPMMLYNITKSEKWLRKTILPMAVNEQEIDQATIEMVKNTFAHVSVKAGIPSDIKAKDIKDYTAPTLLIVGEKDVLFPGKKVIARAEEIILELQRYLMKERGHMNILSAEGNKDIIKLINDFLEK